MVASTHPVPVTPSPATNHSSGIDSAKLYPTVESSVGNTPLIALQRLSAAATARGSVVLAKLEGNNPAGSVKDRAALSMITEAENRGDIKPGDTLIEATSGNTGIALAMVAAIRGYRMILVMPDDLSVERGQTMAAYGAELIFTPAAKSMEHSRDVAARMVAAGKGFPLNQFDNPDNALAHYRTTGPELWAQTGGQITHFVSAMGTTGTISGTARFLKEKSSSVRIVGAEPEAGSRIPGIRRWSPEYVPTIFQRELVDELRSVSQSDAEKTSRALASQEGIFAGISSGGAAQIALQVASENDNATVVFVVCDRGDRYLSTGVFPAPAMG